MQENFRRIWQEIAALIREQVGPEAFRCWFAAIDLAQADEKALTLRAPNNIHQFWIESNYMPIVQAAVEKVLGQPRRICFTFAAREGSESPTDKLADAVTSAPCAPVPVATEPSASLPHPSHGALNLRNTFESFVVGENNRFAHAAAFAVAQSPAKTYNPLFIYGGVGLGKTHLMHAIGHYMIARKKNARVIYISSEQFTNEFIDAIQNNALVRFRKRYRHADALLIDDIHFLAGKERSQEEFFHTFNTLFDGHKQIVLSSDRPATELAGLEVRLVSRFDWGLTAELLPPDIETRVAILRKKAAAMHVKLDNSILEFLAERIRTNVRRLEGALMRVASLSSLNGQALSPMAVEHVLKDILQEEARKTVTIDQIQRRVAEHFDVRLADMTSKRRPANIAFPRQVAMYLARTLTNASLTEIGDAFGGRNHGTVLHACKVLEKRLGGEEKLRQTVSYISDRLRG